MEDVTISSSYSFLSLPPSFAFNSSDLPASAHEHRALRASERERLLLKGLCCLHSFKKGSFPGAFLFSVQFQPCPQSLSPKSSSAGAPTRLFPSISPLRFCLRDPFAFVFLRSEVSLNKGSRCRLWRGNLDFPSLISCSDGGDAIGAQL